VLYDEHTEEIRSMKNPIAALLVLALTAAPVLAGTPAATAPVPWPDTRVGALARGWVTAFNTGEDAMRGFHAWSATGRCATSTVGCSWTEWSGPRRASSR
jgi:hypothetical protein